MAFIQICDLCKEPLAIGEFTEAIGVYGFLHTIGRLECCKVCSGIISQRHKELYDAGEREMLALVQSLRKPDNPRITALYALKQGIES